MGNFDLIVPKLLLNKADDGLKAVEYLRTAGYRAGVVSITYVACVNVARSLLAYDGYDYEPAKAFQLFEKYYLGTGEFDSRLGELFKAVRRFRYESDFNPLFALGDGEVESLISRTRAFRDDVIEYIRGK